MQHLCTSCSKFLIGHQRLLDSPVKAGNDKNVVLLMNSLVIKDACNFIIHLKNIFLIYKIIVIGNRFPTMGKISSGIIVLDSLIDSLYAGDNLVWEVDAG